jgi:hypothetical protein
VALFRLRHRPPSPPQQGPGGTGGGASSKGKEKMVEYGDRTMVAGIVRLLRVVV